MNYRKDIGTAHSARKTADNVRASRAGHTYHERWAARRALQLVFPKDDLFAIVVEGSSPDEHLKLGQEAEDIADLTLFYGKGDTFASCKSQQILQFKYKIAIAPVTSSYLKKTIKKFCATLRALKEQVSKEEIEQKLSFGFVTNAELSSDLQDAIECLKSGSKPKTSGADAQLKNLEGWCKEESIEAREIFPLVEFRASTINLRAQTRLLHRTISDWSSSSSGQAAMRMYALVELVREKAQIEGQGNNSIRREDVLDALGCDEDQLFPADTRFMEVHEVIERSALREVVGEIETSVLPVFLNADGGVGKTVFIQSLAAHLKDRFEIVVFDCFGGGEYRNESKARHAPKVGLLQIINELAVRGLCDPLLPTDADQHGLIEVSRKCLKQASQTVQSQSSMSGILIVLDAADNAQLEANARNEDAFPRLLLASLSANPIDGVKLLLTARPHRMDDVIGKSEVKRLKLDPFTEEETRRFLETRRPHMTGVEFATALARSQGNARVLEYLVASWDVNVSGSAPQAEVLVEELIAASCAKTFRDLHTIGWSDTEVREFFASLALLPPPIPMRELAKALGWSDAQVRSAATDLAPMLEISTHGAIFRDEPTETYVRDTYGSDASAQQSIAERLKAHQKDSIYAAESLPHFLVVIGDSARAYQLATSLDFPAEVTTEYGRRKLRLARLYAAFSLATRDRDLDRVLNLTMQLSQVASANARGDEFIRRSPSLATMLGGTDTSRRLFNDRSGWRGARDARLVVAYCFSNDLNEARVHQSRAIGWINWLLKSDEETKRLNRSDLKAFDVAAVMLPNVINKDLASFNRNIQLWTFKFALSIVRELISLCMQHEASNGSDALKTLAAFAASKRCLSLSLQIGLLSQECGLRKSQVKDVSCAAGALSLQHKKKLQEDQSDYERELQGAISSTAITSLLEHSRQSASNILSLCSHQRPSSYDYGERHGPSKIWVPVKSACAQAWALGQPLSLQQLIPDSVSIGQDAEPITTEEELRSFLEGLIVTRKKRNKKGVEELVESSQFSTHEREDIVKGAACILQLVKPIEMALLSRGRFSNDDLATFLGVWRSTLRPNVHWNSETGRDNVARHVGLGLANILLRFSDNIESKEFEDLIEIVGSNRFSLKSKLNILTLVAGRDNLADAAGSFAAMISRDILKDDYINQRGDSFRDLSASLVPMSIGEAKAYYAQGLAQLDQMGGDDYDLVYSALHYAAEQPGGLVKPELSHRLMNLCQTIFQHEPSKFGWKLFGRAAAASIGSPALYKLLRWADQDVADWSYGLPQLACYLAKTGHLDPRRAAILLSVSEDHGWHEWQVGEGLSDLLSVAAPKDRAAIFSLVVTKLDREHTSGGWEGLWESLLGCVDAFDEIKTDGLLSRFHQARETARRRREIANAKYDTGWSKSGADFLSHDAEGCEKAWEAALTAVMFAFNPMSASALDKEIQNIRASDGLPYDSVNRLLTHLIEVCPYDKRGDFLAALCESCELDFDRVVDLLVDCIEAWRSSSAQVNMMVPDLIRRLFAFKGSELFELRYSGITEQIYRLSNLCNDAGLILQIVLETVAKERIELGGDEWLQLATSLSHHATPSAALQAFEQLLSSSTTKVGDEIGEGPYQSGFASGSSESEILADLLWHLLGDSDAFIRWNAARILKDMLDVGLTEDIGRLLDRFDVPEIPPLVSDGHHFAFLNAQQWLLMGLSRAALHHGDTLRPFRVQLLSLARRPNLHVINKLHIARCLSRIEGDKQISDELVQLWKEIEQPAHGIVERDGWPGNKERRSNFDFEYDFTKYKVADLARLFGISDNEACDCIADEVIKQWPDATGISSLRGGIRYRGDERFETYAEHVQRHARLNAATTLMRSLPVVRRSYEAIEPNPWQEFLQGEDVSFSDGSWLSDHKDRVPAPAHEHMLGTGTGRQEALVSKEVLLRKVGLLDVADTNFLPVYGHWKSPDGVYVRLNAALTSSQGVVKKCAAFSKLPDHELWLPSFGSDGLSDRSSGKGRFAPLIWEPETYPVGIDERDKCATRGAIARPKLGKGLIRQLGLKGDSDERCWSDSRGKLVLRSDVWGEWQPDESNRGTTYQDEGILLWADSNWLDELLKDNRVALIYALTFSKYGSSTSYDESTSVKETYVGAKRYGLPPRFWFAKEASRVKN